MLEAQLLFAGSCLGGPTRNVVRPHCSLGPPAPAGHWGCWRRRPHLPRGRQPGRCSRTRSGLHTHAGFPQTGFQVDLALEMPSWGENTAVRNRLVFPTLKAPELGPGAPSGRAVGVRAELVEEVGWEQFWGPICGIEPPVCRGRRRVLARFQTGDTTGPCSLQNCRVRSHSLQPTLPLVPDTGWAASGQPAHRHLPCPPGAAASHRWQLPASYRWVFDFLWVEHLLILLYASLQFIFL